MKLKTVYFCIAVLTFIVGAIFASTLIEKRLHIVEVEIPALVEPSPAPKPADPVSPQKNTHSESKYLEAIGILRFDPKIEVAETKFKDLSDKPIEFDLDLSHSIENQIIALHSYPNDSREFKIEQQFETSMSVSDEGPHLDLTDWKHYTSDWTEIKRIEGNRFLTSKISEADYERFPKVSGTEIYDAVLKRSEKRWADHARSCKTPNDYPCLVSVSRISFRIMAKENGKWSVIHRINVLVPMGC